MANGGVKRFHQYLPLLISFITAVAISKSIDGGGGCTGSGKPVSQQLIHGVELALRLGVQLVNLAAVLIIQGAYLQGDSVAHRQHGRLHVLLGGDDAVVVACVVKAPSCQLAKGPHGQSGTCSGELYEEGYLRIKLHK